MLRSSACLPQYAASCIWRTLSPQAVWLSDLVFPPSLSRSSGVVVEQADLEFTEVWLPLSQSAGPLPPGETGPLIIQVFFRIEAAWPMTLTFRASLSPAAVFTDSTPGLVPLMNMIKVRPSCLQGKLSSSWTVPAPQIL